MRETAGGDRSARPRHQILIVVEVDDGQEHAAERLAAAKEVMQIGAGKVARGRAAAFRIERPRIAGVTSVPDVDRPEAREGEAVAAIARGQHAIEHVDAACDRLEKIVGRAYSHEIARL